MLDPEISIDNYKILQQGGGVVENIFFEMLLPNSKPITLGTIYLSIYFPNYQNYNDINEAYNDFIQKIINVIDKVAPMK